MIKLKFHNADTGYARIYFKGDNNKLYCLQEHGRFSFELMNCSPNGEPDDKVKYHQLLDFSAAIESLSATIQNTENRLSSPYRDLLCGGNAALNELNSKKIKIIANSKEFILVENYRDHLIAVSNDVLAIINPADCSVFIPGVDDSKSNGIRKDVPTVNNVRACRECIDHWVGQATYNLTINTFDEDGSVIGNKQVSLKQEQIEDIISHAVQSVEFPGADEIRDELASALESYDVMESERNSMSPNG